MDVEPHTTGVPLSKALSKRRFFHATEIVVSSCCTDYRHCRSGDLFVALVDADADGHEFAQLAVSKGATAVLTERLLPLPVPQCVVPSTHAALARLCQRLSGDPAESISVLGIAGRHDMTPMRSLLQGVLRAAGHMPAGFGQQELSDGFETHTRRSSETTHAQYAQWLSTAVGNGCSHGITELPRQDVARQIYAGVPFDSLVLTGVQPRPEAPLLAIEHYLNRVLSQLRPQGLLVADIDCDMLADTINRTSNPTLTVAMHRSADITGRLLERHPSEQTFLLEAGNDTAVVRTKIIGQPHIRNCLLAAATGLGMGFDLSTVVAGLESIERVPGYLDRVECGQHFSVFADACDTPERLRQTLRSVREITRGKLLCVFGQGGSRTKAWMRGRLVEQLADASVITSDDDLDMQPLGATHDVLDGYQRPAAAQVIPSRTTAIRWAVEQAQPGDTVLLAGPHHQQMARNSSNHFSDADVARHCLLELATAVDPDWLLSLR